MYGSSFNNNYEWDIVGMRLPNGKVKVVRNNYGPIGEVFDSDSAFYGKYQHTITEGSDNHNVTVGIYDSING